MSSCGLSHAELIGCFRLFLPRPVSLKKKKKKPEGHSLQVVTLGGAGMEAVAGGDEHTTPDRKI